MITGFDTLLFLAIQNFGMRRFEGFVICLIAVVGACFIFEVIWSRPVWTEIAKGFVPRLPEGALYVAIGIIGATVMPHNLYLHSALVQTRAYDSSPEGNRQACRFNLIDSAVALNCAFLVNSAILIVAAAAFHQRGIVVTELQQAHSLLSPLLGTALAGILFAVDLLCAGQASTLTGTLAGQIVMEGYLRFKIRPFLRRLFTRSLALIPAAGTIIFAGETGTYKLLILSQVILSLQLPFAIIPLIHFTSDKGIMGEFANETWVKILAWIVATVIVSLNVKLVVEKITEWISESPDPIMVGFLVIPTAAGVGGLLVYITLKPFVRLPGRELVPGWKKLSHFIRAKEDRMLDLDVPHYKRVGVAVAHEERDRQVLSHALSLARQHNAEMCLFHVVEGAGGLLYGPDAYDEEARQDEQYLTQLGTSLGHRGVDVEVFLGFGAVAGELIRLAEEQHVDILVMGGHGHRGLADLVFGTTVSPVRHRLTIPVVIVR